METEQIIHMTIFFCVFTIVVFLAMWGFFHFNEIFEKASLYDAMKQEIDLLLQCNMTKPIILCPTGVP